MFDSFDKDQSSFTSIFAFDINLDGAYKYEIVYRTRPA